MSRSVARRSFELSDIKGVGPRIKERLARLGIHRSEDLLFHLPLRYEDRTRLTPIGSLRPGTQAVVQGTVRLSEIKYGRRRSLLCHIADGTGHLVLRFFYFSAAQQNNLKAGTTVRCFGEVRRGPSALEMVHPEYQRLDGDEPEPVAEHFTPVYPTTEGLHQLSLRQFVDQALQWLEQGRLELAELLPREVRDAIQLPSLREALFYIHRPPPDAALETLVEGQHPMQLRLAFEELLAQTLSLRQLRNQTRHFGAPRLSTEARLQQQFFARLPFSLTAAQQRVIAEINHDLGAPVPMQRLIQGDVGSGKTVVAAGAALNAIEAGRQVALMAPTEILAEQHYHNFHDWLQALNINVCWLSGKLKSAQRKQVLNAVASGEAQVVVGTHALFQEGVEFHNLALVVVDEQHRFGVHQRLALREKGAQRGLHPHQLIMTATPIPRTLAMTAYADLDCSVIDELPPGRKPVETVVIPDSRREEIVQRVASACAEGRQVYWVCTLIEESEQVQCEAAENTAVLLGEALPQFRVGLVHGRMKAEEKEQTMAAFKRGEVDLLVATTVIEVGVDVPNASLMIIENAERLGLAQLHQLRGRVGRGEQASVCVLMYHAPLSRNARARLNTMRETNNGFLIAQKDLELRGPGEVLGTRQTGLLQMRVADLTKHQQLLPQVNRWADPLVRDHPQEVQGLIQRWVGEATRFAQV